MNKTATTYLINPVTGTVDTRDNWMDEMHGWENPEQEFSTLIEVRLADDAEVPADFQPCQSGQFDWVEVN